MAEEIPISEVRRVVVEFEIRIPQGGQRLPQPEQPTVDDDLVEEVRRRLVRDGSRNLDVFGGRA